jgi:hypothetical protein
LSTHPARLERLARAAEGLIGRRCIQLRRTQGWRLPPGALSCARPGPYGNRYVIGRKIEHPESERILVRDRAHTVALFREWLDWQMAQLPIMRDELRHDLGGGDPAYWCALDQPCHVDAYLKVANR